MGLDGFYVIILRVSILGCSSLLGSRAEPSKYSVGWIELDPRSTASRNAKLKDCWLKGNMMKDEQNHKRVMLLAEKVYSKILE